MNFKLQNIYIIIIPLNKEPSNRALHVEKQIIQNTVEETNRQS